MLRILQRKSLIQNSNVSSNKQHVFDVRNPISMQYYTSYSSGYQGHTTGMLKLPQIEAEATVSVKHTAVLCQPIYFLLPCQHPNQQYATKR